MANMVARPQTLQDYLRDQLGWFEIDAPPAGDVRADHLQSRRQRLPARPPGGPAGPGGDEGRPGPGAEGPGRGAAARSARRGGPRHARNVCSCSSRPDMPLFEELQTLITTYLDDLEHNRLPVISRRTGYSIELIQQADRGIAEAQAPPRRRVQQRPGSARHARRLRRIGRGRQVSDPPGGRPHAQPLHQPLLPQALRQRADQQRDAGVHQAEDQFGPVADRFHPAAAEHA